MMERRGLLEREGICLAVRAAADRDDRCRRRPRRGGRRLDRAPDRGRPPPHRARAAGADRGPPRGHPRLIRLRVRPRGAGGGSWRRPTRRRAGTASGTRRRARCGAGARSGCAADRPASSRAAANSLASDSSGGYARRGSGRGRRRLLDGRIHRVLSAPHGSLVPVKAPVTELVADGEATARRPLARLPGVDPDLPQRRQQQAGQSLRRPEGRYAGRGAQVVDVTDVQTEAGVGDVIDRHREAVAVPQPAGHLRQHALGLLLDLRRHGRPDRRACSATPAQAEHHGVDRALGGGGPACRGAGRRSQLSIGPFAQVRVGAQRARERGRERAVGDAQGMAVEREQWVHGSEVATRGSS